GDAVPALTATLTDPNETVRHRAAIALGEIGSPAVPPLVAALADPDERLHQHAEQALVKIGAPAVPALDEARRSPNTIVRSAVIRILGRLAPEVLASEIVAPVLKDSDYSAEDQQILAWFANVDLAQYLTPLQLFWCIGQVDRAAFESGGQALGYGK